MVDPEIDTQLCETAKVRFQIQWNVSGEMINDGDGVSPPVFSELPTKKRQCFMRTTSAMKVGGKRMLLANSCCPASYFPDPLAVFLHEHSDIKGFTLCTVQVQVSLKQKRTISYKFMNPFESFLYRRKFAFKYVVAVISSNQPQSLLRRRHFNMHRSFPVSSILGFHENLTVMSTQPLGELVNSGIFVCFRQVES
ncbi:hypothetical protein D3C78_1248410 [compost metagenome]